MWMVGTITCIYNKIVCPGLIDEIFSQLRDLYDTFHNFLTFFLITAFEIQFLLLHYILDILFFTSHITNIVPTLIIAKPNSKIHTCTVSATKLISQPWTGSKNCSQVERSTTLSTPGSYKFRSLNWEACSQLGDALILETESSTWLQQTKQHTMLCLIS